VNYLATAPKSNRSYRSLHAARDAVAMHPSAPVLKVTYCAATP